MSESSKNSEKTSDNDENDEIVFTHPVVTEKKGYMDLTDYERNYQNMEARAKMQHVQSRTEEKSMEKVHHDQSGKREDDIVPKSSTNENDRERYREEPKVTTSKITEKNENGKIDILTNTTKEHENISIDNTRKIDGLEDDSNTSELTDILSPEEAYIRHLERVIAANALPPENMKILKDLYTRYNFNKKHASTIEETRAETDIKTSDLGESMTNTRDQIENAPILDDEKPILDSSLKDSNNVLQSNTQEVSKNSIITESSAMDDEKLKSLENTDLFANNDEILTSTPKNSKEKISISSNLENKQNILCDITSMTIESPFSDISLQTVKLKSGLRNHNVIKEESDLVKRQDNKDVINGLIEKKNNEEVNVTGIEQGQVSSSSVSSNSQYPTSLDVSRNVQLFHQQNVLWSKNMESFITEDDLACRCPQTEPDAIFNENNNNQSIIYRIRRYFLSFLIDYLVPRQVRSTKSKVSCT